MNIRILRFDSIDSTNTEALKQAKMGAEEGLSIVAREQTSGHGRLGRKWVSERDAGLYFSIVLRPEIETRSLPLLTLMTAVAVHDVLSEQYQLLPDIKWSNDVHIKGKKISGILAETVETKTGLAVIVGIGINLRSSAFPPEISDIATSLERETGKPPDAGETLNYLIRFFGYFYEMLQTENGGRHILEEWAKRSSYFEGKKVRVHLENETFTGTTRGLEDNGALRVETENSGIKIVQAGDVESLRTTEN